MSDLPKRCFQLEASLVTTSQRPTFDGSVSIREIPMSELQLVEARLDGQPLEVHALANDVRRELRKAANALVAALLPNSPVKGFVVNESKPIGPIWIIIPGDYYLHPIDTNGAVCVSTVSDANGTVWIQLELRALPITCPELSASTSAAKLAMKPSSAKASQNPAAKSTGKKRVSKKSTKKVAKKAPKKKASKKASKTVRKTISKKGGRGVR